MVSSTPTVVDVDAHYTDHFEDILEYMDDDDPWKERFSISATKYEPSDIRISLFPTMSGSKRSMVKRHNRGSETREDIVGVMDHLGVDKVLLFSNLMLMFGLMSSGDLRQTAFANGYMDFMLDRIADADDGIYLAVPAPLDNPDRAAELVDRVADEQSVVSVCVVSGRTEPPLGHRRYEPIYAAAADAGLPVTFHGASAFLDEFYVKGFSGVFEPHALGFVWDNMAAMASIIAEGVPEKFPDLDMVFLESGLFWVPMMMYRLDMEYLRQEWEAELLERRPSAYMQEMYYGTQPLEVVPSNRYFEYVIEMLGGAERLMFATDYPHDDYDDVGAIREMAFLSDEERAQILGRTAERVFGI